MSIISKISLGSMLVCSLYGHAQQSNLFPQPQQITYSQGSMKIEGAWSFKSKIALSPELKGVVDTYFNTSDKKEKQQLIISKISRKDSQYKKKGAYHLNIEKGRINIEANDQQGVFYAFQTLSQLLNQQEGSLSIPFCSITDYADVAYRGTVEGFYGEPWSHQDRIEQLRFYGKLKLNTYIYGPKDDPYHSSPHWRKAYPTEEAQRIKELVDVANENYVDFVWAIHPGKDIQWNKADSLAIIEKFDMMYDLGVRSFAVFFDDISGIGTDATKQAELLNYIQKEFIEKKEEQTPLIMCPTQYNKAWSDPKPGTYLDILGEKLHPNVQVMWTGNTVVHDITTEGLQWVNKRIQRPSYVWWNFPVSDYVRDHLLMGPAYGIETNAKEEMSGFVSNPMDKAEPSKVAIFSVANYSWNMDGYDSQKSWEDACEFVMPEAAESFKCFNRHNSDPGHNWHRYRREESVEIAPVIDRYIASLEKGSFARQEAKELLKEFTLMQKSANDIEQNCLNPRLLEQIKPWLTQFETLAELGIESMYMMDDLESGDLGQVWEHMIKTGKLQTAMTHLDQTVNQNPFQPGVKTGSLRLTPFVKRINHYTENFLLEQLGEKKEKGVLTSAPSVYTNIDRMQHQQINDVKGKVSLTPILEVMDFKKGEYIGLSWGKDRLATQLSFNLSSDKVGQHCNIEISEDGLHWKKPAVKIEKTKVTIKDNLDQANYLRIQAKETFPIRLTELMVVTKENNKIEPNYFALDNNLQSYHHAAYGKTTSYAKPNDKEGNTVTILSSDITAPLVVKGVDKEGKTTTLYVGKQKLVNLQTTGLSAITITSQGSANIHEVVWK